MYRSPHLMLVQAQRGGEGMTPTLHKQDFGRRGCSATKSDSLTPRVT